MGRSRIHLLTDQRIRGAGGPSEHSLAIVHTIARSVLIAAIILMTAISASPAQVRHVESMGSIRRKVETISPRAGPPGTTITVASGLMPAITPLRIGFGGNDGFEELTSVLTTTTGEFSVTVTVPAWAESTRSYRFIAFDVYFRPLALSDLFHVTDENGRVRREGEITGGTTCKGLRDRYGDLYALVGDTATRSAGERVTVEGTITERADCEGVPIRVERITRGTT